MTELKRQPTHVGEVLKEEFLAPLGITQSALAKALHASFRAINELVNEKRGVTTEMALKLAKYFGTSPQLWLNPNYAIEITNLPQIIGSWAFTAYASMHLWVHLRYTANTHKPSISRIFGNSIA